MDGHCKPEWLVIAIVYSVYCILGNVGDMKWGIWGCNPGNDDWLMILRGGKADIYNIQYTIYINIQYTVYNV